MLGFKKRKLKKRDTNLVNYLKKKVQIKKTWLSDTIPGWWTFIKGELLLGVSFY
jgi:hypothetical protein